MSKLRIRNIDDIQDNYYRDYYSVIFFSNTEYSVATAKANGTFGELLQGYLLNGKSFMVTFPINLFSFATFIPDAKSNVIVTIPQHKKKSTLLAYKLLELFNLKVGGVLIINSELPEGKGLASSSADLVATAYAVSKAVRITVNQELIAELIRGIEPSDGIMYEGIVSFYYKELKLIESIGNLNNLVVVAIDEGDVIDTLEYNQRKKIYNYAEAIKYESMLCDITYAIKNKNLKMVGKISTQSAIMNQQHNPKKFLDQCIKICSRINGVGVTVAHSGTFLGILLDNQSPEFISQKAECIKKFRKISNKIKMFHVI